MDLKRYADKIYPSEKEFLEALEIRKLTIYHGVDPTAPDLHLGHSTNYLLLRKFQDLGHKIIILIGDFTAQIGDPTGRISERKTLTKEQVLKNAQTYKAQISKILDFKSKTNPARLKFNSKWYEKINFNDLMKLMANFTHGQMIKRNMFQQRLKNGQEINFIEFIYPMLQGYDSVAMDVDAEVGGTDQTFNMMAGRDLLKKYKNKEKFVITTKLLENPKTGKKLMSKSEGNYVALNDFPNEMFGKIMALPDEAVMPCFELCTEISLLEVVKIKNPKDLKIRLAREIITMYHNKKEAERAEKEFNKIFKEKKLPSDIPEIKMKEAELNILDLLVKTKLASSRSEARRLVEQKAVKINADVKNDWKSVIEIKKGLVIQVGKRRFIKLK
ncbi:MAG: tyrosine--tRNA ligase [bacterium]|nr:tyrosine--tRNA ligase [bacterium]